MYRPQTPDPSSDPLQPGSSPSKRSNTKSKLQLGHSDRRHASHPFAPIDFNSKSSSQWPITEDASAPNSRSLALALTPPPSSPPSLVHDGLRSSSPASNGPASSPIKPSTTAGHSVTLTKGPLSSVQQESVEPNLDESNDPNVDPNAGFRQSGEDPSTLSLFASYTHSIVIGRSKPSGLPHASSRSSSPFPLGAAEEKEEDREKRDAPPTSTSGLGSRRVMRLNLPNDARHVSRVHAIVEWVPFVQRQAKTSSPRAIKTSSAAGSTQPGARGGTFIVKIVGQNGLIVDGKRRRGGQVLRLIPGKTVLDFFGYEAKVEVEEKAPPKEALLGGGRRSSPVAARSFARRLGSSPTKRQSSFRPKNLATSSTTSSDLFRQASIHPPSTRVETIQSSPPRLQPSPIKPSLLSKGGGVPSEAMRADRMEVEDEQEDDDEGESSPSPTGRKSLHAAAAAAAATEPRRKRPLAISESESDSDSDSDSDRDESGNFQVEETRSRSRNTAKTVGQRKRNRARPWAAEGDEIVDDSLDEEDESDLTPSPSPSRSTSPRPSAAKRRRDGGGSKSSKRVVVDQARREADAREAKPTDSQVKMPPPPPKPTTVATRSRPSGVASVSETNNGRGPRSSNSPAPQGQLQDQARRCVRLLAQTYDLPGLLAGAVVFHRTATISASEAVRSVLSSTPGLMKGQAGERSVAFSPTRRKMPNSDPSSSSSSVTCSLSHGQVVEGWGEGVKADRWESIARKAWREHLEVVLQSSPMFGVITRAGKDASGNPLECWYYYDKEKDPDVERASNLGLFAKPMRKALRGQKPIFWKRSAYGHKEEGEEGVNNKAEEALVEVEHSRPSSALPVTARVDEEGGDHPKSEERKYPPPQAEEDDEEDRAGKKRRTKGQEEEVVSENRPEEGGEGGGGRSTKRGKATTEEEEEEIRRELLRARIAKSGVWDETQPEEKDGPSWDKVGDLDYGNGAGGRSRRGRSGSPAVRKLTR
ncbi:hypothetical protein IE53DRAFT_135348 [Violaceomyces palustris]|uniref:Uncharacterized protein n=1 Tax=Violaceomyces palustris TaxID=1673888 RepID=A0ACD0NV13_9BASI|nr:hypothetical protein IE53DRAFT_135348 [Violaceomyces palustris]